MDRVPSHVSLSNRPPLSLLFWKPVATATASTSMDSKKYGTQRVAGPGDLVGPVELMGLSKLGGLGRLGRLGRLGGTRWGLVGLVYFSYLVLLYFHIYILHSTNIHVWVYYARRTTLHTHTHT